MDAATDGGTGSGALGGPRILSLTANTRALTPEAARPWIISAIVTDPDGIDDVIGGLLETPDRASTYGTFATSAEEGGYEMRLTWADLHAVRPIDFPAGGTTRTVLARFFDAAGNEATEMLDLTLRCGRLEDAACDGACVDLETSRTHCGACDRRVEPPRICRSGEPACPEPAETYCPTEGVCADLERSSDHCGRCGRSVEWPLVCREGRPSCYEPGETYCPATNECADLDTSRRHCGRCGASLPEGIDGADVDCIDGRPVCFDEEETYCPRSGECVNTDWDRDNCGRCGNEIPSGAYCDGGSPRCPDYARMCGGSSCVDLRTTSNCGACGARCPRPDDPERASVGRVYCAEYGRRRQCRAQVEHVVGVGASVDEPCTQLCRELGTGWDCYEAYVDRRWDSVSEVSTSCSNREHVYVRRCICGQPAS